MQTISELNNFLHDIEQKNSVSFPTNYNNFVQIFADDVKFSKEHLSPENLEKNLQDMKIDFNLKTQVLYFYIFSDILKLNRKFSRNCKKSKH